MAVLTRWSTQHRKFCHGGWPIELFAFLVVATSLYVAPDGNDDADGSLAAPFATLQHCVTQLLAHGPGANCTLRQGTYHFATAVRAIGLHGEADAPYTIAAYEGEDVMIDGTVDVVSPWIWSSSLCPAGCWYADMPAETKPWQLFLDRELLTPARWPNAFWADKTVFDSSHWAVSSGDSTFQGGKFIASRHDGTSGLRTEPYSSSVMVDASRKCDRRLETACDHSGCAAAICHPDSGSLANAHLPNGTALNVTGATAIMNLGSWTTHAALVEHHAPGTGMFTYRAADDWPVRKFVPEHNIYFLENKLDLLDAPTEWFFDKDIGRIYLMTEGDSDPTGRVRARVQDYALMIRDASYLTVRGLKFFATSVFATAQQGDQILRYCRFESLEFMFAGGMRRMLGELEHANPLVLWTGWNEASGNNTIFNSTFFGIDGWPVFTNFENGQLAIENCLFEYIDWTCLHSKHPKKFHDNVDTIEYHTYWGDSYTLVAGNGDANNPNRFERNSVLHHGASEGLQLKDNTVARLNRIGHKYSLQNDGALIQTSGHDLMKPGGITVKQNWVHDSINARNAKWGIRVDRVQTSCEGAGDGNTWGFRVSVEENVIWRTLGIELKGNNHTARNNVVLWPGGKDHEDAGKTKHGGFQIYTSDGEGTCQCGSQYCIANSGKCCVEGQLNTFEGINTIATFNAFDVRGSIRGGSAHFPSTAAVDAALGVPGAAYNSAGGAAESLRDPKNFDFRPKAASYIAATCIGAYGAIGHGEHYWIPGRQMWTASFPVPPSGAETRAEVDLMFLPGLNAHGHRVYASTVNPGSLDLLGTLYGSANVFTPPTDLHVQPGATVYWRVDAFDAVGVRAGPTWNFSVESLAPAAPKMRCRTNVASDTPVALPDGESVDASFLKLPPLTAVYNERVSVKNWTVCVNLTVNTTLSDWHVRTVARYGQGATWATHFSELDRWKNPDGASNRYLQACFDDTITDKLSSVDNWGSASPITGLWQPESALLAKFAENHHVIEETEVDYRLKLFDHTYGDGGGVLEGWSVKVCFETLPLPNRSQWPESCLLSHVHSQALAVGTNGTPIPASTPVTTSTHSPAPLFMRAPIICYPHHINPHCPLEGQAAQAQRTLRR